jgi:hypothetical protein
MITTVDLEERYGLLLLFVWADVPAKSLVERSVHSSFFDNASYLFDEIPVTRVLTSTEFIFISLKQKTIFSLFLNKGYVVATLCIYGPVWINSL